MKSLLWLVVLAFSVSTTSAYAHSPIPGMMGFYVGLLHPFSAPAQLLLMLGLGLLVGTFDVSRIRYFIGCFVTATIVGAMVGNGVADLNIVMLSAAFIACAWAALVPGKYSAVVLTLVAIIGVLIGMETVPGPGPDRDRMITMMGSIVGANIGLLYSWGAIQFVTDRVHWHWLDVVFRVIAAWSSAIALILLALQYSNKDVPLLNLFTQVPL